MRHLVLIAVTAVLLANPELTFAQDKCVVLCTPEFKFEPTVTFENLFNPATVVEVGEDGPLKPIQAERETVFEFVFAVGIPTEIPRIGLTVEAIWAPFAGTSTNAFTGTTAGELGVEEIADNPVELEFELNFTLFEPEQTAGWVGMHFDVVDKFSPSERPQDTGVYTHKLNFELDTAIHILSWLPQGNWLRNLELEWSLDYVATGIPQAGDQIGDELFLTDASPWSLSMVVVIPVAPLWP